MSVLKIKKLGILSLILSFLIGIDFFNIKEINAGDNNKEKLDNYIRNIPNNNFYILGPGDVLSLKVSENSKELDKLFSINNEGLANLKRLKRIYVAGLTIGELTNILNSEYANYVNNPDVELDVQIYRPLKVYIDGEIEIPGIHVIPGSYSTQDELLKFHKFQKKEKFPTDFSDNSANILNLPLEGKAQIANTFFPTLMDVIRQSGGVTNFADLSNITVVRNNSISNGGGKISSKVNLMETINLKDESQNLRIMDGDLIEIPKATSSNSSQIAQAYKSNINPRFIEVSIRPPNSSSMSSIQLPRNSSLNQAVEIATNSFLTGDIKFLRFNY